MKVGDTVTCGDKEKGTGKVLSIKPDGRTVVLWNGTGEQLRHGQDELTVQEVQKVPQKSGEKEKSGRRS